jgi:hypothetical protein
LIVRPTFSVYVAKHDIFATDVTNCFVSLKKAVNEMRTAGVPTDSLELATTSVRSDAVTFTGMPGNEALFDLIFDLHEPV